MMRTSTWLAGVAAATLIGTAVPASAETPPPTPSSGTASRLATIQTEMAGAPAGHMRPLWQPATTTGVTPRTIGVPGGYDPDVLRAHLRLSGTGKGQTVAIVVAFDVSAAVTKAVTSYSEWYGLKPPCSETVTSGCFPLKVVAPNGTAPIDTDTALPARSFQVEADLDVEMVHAVAPDAAITVVEGYDNSTEAMMAALDHAVSLHPAVINNSYGMDEFDGERDYDGRCTATGVLCVFASGDAGNPGLWPAAAPDVLAVGGTTLDMDSAGKVRSEVAWQGSGGGISPFEPRPAYQRAAVPNGTGRGVPDVSFDADPQSGFAVYVVIDVSPFPIYYDDWAMIGGTSAGAPIWSAIAAVADQQRAAHREPPLTAGQVHAAVYAGKTKTLADITAGANGLCDTCWAGPGYDLVTGKGSPRAGIDTYLARH
ncbi:S53 family peptidase [Actinoallomurus iriomotensis]|nr:S53 family peptidase [Actinoallomurus iriomotensis]